MSNTEEAMEIDIYTDNAEGKCDKSNCQGVPNETTQKKDKTTIHLDVVWPEEKHSKWENKLQIALQSWFNKNTSDTECLSVTAQDNGSVKIEITPASGQEDQFVQETKLTVKDQTGTALVKRVMSGDSTGTPMTNDFHLTSLTPSAPPVTVSCNLPLVHFCYVNQVYREKMKCIEKENRVKIHPDVTVSFRVDPSTEGDPDKALSEFTNLVQSCLGDSNCFTYTHKLGQVDWEKTLKFIQQDQEKLTLTVSSPHEVDVCGPMKSLKAFESITKMQKKIVYAEIPGPSSARGAHGKSHRFTLNSRDPLFNSGLTMDATHSKIMFIAQRDEVAKIESKFGVNFRHMHGTVSAIAKPGTSEEAITLESHALGAFLRLYQRVATSVTSRSLLSPSRVNIEEGRLEEILSGLSGVVPDKQGDQWRIIGLPKNLRQAVDQIEKNLGRPIFEDEDKQMIGCMTAAVDGAGLVNGCVTA